MMHTTLFSECALNWNSRRTIEPACPPPMSIVRFCLMPPWERILARRSSRYKSLSAEQSAVRAPAYSSTKLRGMDILSIIMPTTHTPAEITEATNTRKSSAVLANSHRLSYSFIR